MVAGLTDGLEDVELKPDGLLAQLYVLPATAVAPMEMGVPEHVLELVMVAAAGSAFTVMATELVLVQPVAVMVSVNV